MDLVIIRARDLQRLHGTKHAAFYLKTLGLPVEAAVAILARGASVSSTPKPPRAITAEDWDYWLGCMPPCKWQAVAGGEAFHCMELLNFDLAIWCVRLGDAYYRVDASPRLAPQAVADLVTLAESPA